MEVEAVRGLRAKSVPRKKLAFWHFAEVVLVQKLACVAFFTQTAEPMLANDSGGHLLVFF